MDLTSDHLAAFGVGLIIIIGAVGKYITSRTGQSRPLDPVLAGVGIGYGEREQMERLIVIQTRIAVAMETLADKRTDEMVEMHKQLLERMDRRAEQEESSPRRTAPRRRRPT